MLFMDIITWEPKDNDEMTKRYSKWKWPEGVTVVSEWIDLSTCRYVGIYDIKNAEDYASSAFPWRDICRIDTFPVMEASEFMKFISEHILIR